MNKLRWVKKYFLYGLLGWIGGFSFPASAFYMEIYERCISSEEPLACVKKEWQSLQKAVDKQTTNTLSESKKISTKCPVSCSNQYMAQAMSYGSVDVYTELRDHITAHGESCAQNILDTLQERTQNLEFPKVCVESESKLCAFLFEQVKNLNGKISELLDEIGIKLSDTTEAKALCVGCGLEHTEDKDKGYIKTTLNNLKNQSQCQLPEKAGEEKIVQTGKPLKQSYILKKEPDGSFSIPFNIDFSADRDYDGPVPAQYVPDYYLTKAQEVYAKSQHKNAGARGSTN